ncbi:hypothetical protein BU15DRAFT_67367 [Melanogaster broomeanus]|nr:hypothetical protein BU15DRAFT_67367 [Melanogaster broomeanus]
MATSELIAPAEKLEASYVLLSFVVTRFTPILMGTFAIVYTSKRIRIRQLPPVYVMRKSTVHEKLDKQMTNNESSIYTASGTDRQQIDGPAPPPPTATALARTARDAGHGTRDEKVCGRAHTADLVYWQTSLFGSLTVFNESRTRSSRGLWLLAEAPCATAHHPHLFPQPSASTPSLHNCSLHLWLVAPCLKHPATCNCLSSPALSLDNCSSSPSVPSALSLDTLTTQPLALPVACGSLPEAPCHMQLLVVPSPQPRQPRPTTGSVMISMHLTDVGSTITFCNTNLDVAHAGLLCPRVLTSLVTPFLYPTSINLYATINTT